MIGRLSVLAPCALVLATAVSASAAPQVAGARTAPAGSSSQGSASARTPPAGSSSTGTASPTNGGSPSSGVGGSSSNGSQAEGRSDPFAGTTVSSSAPSRNTSQNNLVLGARDRSTRPVIGTATPRQTPNVGGVAGSFEPGTGFSRFGHRPWYSTGYDFGYFAFDPWAYGYGVGSFGLYGMGYSPYGYFPYGAPGYGGGGGAAASAIPHHETGSIRLKVNPSGAKVYVDGVLVGVAGDFDGLVSHHLVLESGTHALELRIDGYQTLSTTIKVEAGQTVTERVNLKKG